jgi:hypothetical protein
MDSISYGSGSFFVDIFFGIAGLLILPVVILGLAFVLYFFTGEKKKADLIQPHLMGYSLKVFAYVWMLIISFIAQILGFLVVNYILSSIVGQGRFNTSDMLIIPLIMLAVMFLLLFGAMKLNRSVVKETGRGAGFPSKIIFSVGLVINSIVAFLSGFSTLGSILNALFGSSAYYRPTVEPEAISLFIVSLAASLILYAKAMQIVKREIK